MEVRDQWSRSEKARLLKGGNGKQFWWGGGAGATGALGALGISSEAAGT